MRHPLSPFTYYARHKGQTLLLVVLIGSLTLGVFLLVGVMLTVATGSLHTYNHLTRMSRIVAGQALDTGSVAQIRAHPDVVAVLAENGMSISFPNAATSLDSRPVLGITEDNLELAMEVCDLRLKEGRLISPRAAEIILSEEIARALDLQIGDVISHDVDEHFYATIASDLTLVGILESVPSEAEPAVLAGFVSYEYVDAHEEYQPRLSNLLVVPRQGHRITLNGFIQPLVDENTGPTPVRLETFEGETAQFRQLLKVHYGLWSFADGVVAVAAALVVGMVSRIAVARRLPELGLLHATGLDKQDLVSRLALEITFVTGIGWGFGLLLALGCSHLLNSVFTAAVEPVINLRLPILYVYTLPIPLVVTSWVTLSIRRVLRELDTVAIIERGRLSMETGGKKQKRVHAKAGHPLRNPLSTWTFHWRHRRRSLALVLCTGLMVLGVTLPAFVSMMLIDAVWPFVLSYASHISLVSPAPTYQTVGPAVLAEIRAHPAVADVIPVKAMTVMANVVPFEFPLPAYGVREEDMQALLDVYDLHIAEGEMFQPRSGQIVLTRALARNRGLRVGDKVGRSVHEMDSMPTELTIVGLLDSQTRGLTEREGYRIPTAPRWAGFVSYEFVESHEEYDAVSTHALVIPVEGRETEVEAWLEESIDSPQVDVETFGTVYRWWHDFTQMAMRSLAITETTLAVVAAGALAILNYIFVIQRRDEFGVLHAVGHSRARLVARTVQESATIAGVAWVIGAVCCLVFVLGAQATIYAPKGMSLYLTDVVPWLFTLPIPLAVILVSAATIGRMLRRLDPVLVIEGR